MWRRNPTGRRGAFPAFAAQLKRLKKPAHFVIAPVESMRMCAAQRRVRDARRARPPSNIKR
jgi:hypothetical protein